MFVLPCHFAHATSLPVLHLEGECLPSVRNLRAAPHSLHMVLHSNFHAALHHMPSTLLCTQCFIPDSSLSHLGILGFDRNRLGTLWRWLLQRLAPNVCLKHVYYVSG